MKAPCPRTGLGKRLDYLIKAVVVGGQRDKGPEEGAATVHEHDFVTLMKTKHTNGMQRLILWQLTLVSCIRDIEIADFLHGL
jgi:hypothetical protein